MKIITVSFLAKPESKSEVITLCKSMILPSREEPGCIYYSFYQDLHEDNRFFFYEEWEDQKSIDAHNSSKHFLEFQPKFRNLIIGDAEINVYSVSH